MTAGATPLPSLEFLAEPTLVVQRDGRIVGANGPARRLFAGDPVGSDLFGRVFHAPEEVEALLRRASGSSSPTIGGVRLNTAAGPGRFRLHAARLAQGANGPVLVLRLLAGDADQFALLNRRVHELDRQLRQRIQEKAALEEALRLNQTLLDELQHRVKNNIQMMMSLIRISAEDRGGPEVAEMVASAILRLQAMASTQEAVYRSVLPGIVRSGDFLRGLVASIGESAGFAGAIDADIADLELGSDQAHCVALIVNELVTNAGKHGMEDRSGKVRVTLAPNGGEIELVVKDDGPGMPALSGKHASGLHLVRSLCRQIGGRLDIETGNGTTCRVRFGRVKESWA